MNETFSIRAPENRRWSTWNDEDDDDVDDDDDDDGYFERGMNVYSTNSFLTNIPIEDGLRLVNKKGEYD